MVDHIQNAGEGSEEYGDGFLAGADFVISGVLHLLTDEHQKDIEAWRALLGSAWRASPYLPVPAFPELNAEG